MYKSKILLTIAGGLLMTSALALTGCDSKPQVGIVNFNLVQKKAKAYQSAEEQQKKYDEQVQAKILKDKDFIQLQEEGKALSEQQKTMPAAEFERKSAALQARALKINEKYRNEFERNAYASQLALKAIEQQIAEAIEATAKKSGAKILLPVNSILYAAEQVDLTDMFVQELDSRAQSVEYPDPTKL